MPKSRPHSKKLAKKPSGRKRTTKKTTKKTRPHDNPSFLNDQTTWIGCFDIDRQRRIERTEIEIKQKISKLRKEIKAKGDAFNNWELVFYLNEYFWVIYKQQGEIGIAEFIKLIPTAALSSSWVIDALLELLDQRTNLERILRDQTPQYFSNDNYSTEFNKRKEIKDSITMINKKLKIALGITTGKGRKKELGISYRIKIIDLVEKTAQNKNNTHEALKWLTNDKNPDKIPLTYDRLRDLYYESKKDIDKKEKQFPHFKDILELLTREDS